MSRSSFFYKKLVALSEHYQESLTLKDEIVKGIQDIDNDPLLTSLARSKAIQFIEDFFTKNVNSFWGIDHRQWAELFGALATIIEEHSMTGNRLFTPTSIIMLANQKYHLSAANDETYVALRR
jgi:hypothetical protein